MLDLLVTLVSPESGAITPEVHNQTAQLIEELARILQAENFTVQPQDFQRFGL